MKFAIRNSKITWKYQILVILIVLLLVPVYSASGDTTNGSLEEEISFHILAINDFHGQITPGKTINETPVGSAEVLSAYLDNALSQYRRDTTIIALPGDTTGVSPAESELLLDEPALLFFNTFADQACANHSDSRYTTCNIIATVGNHEFDYGVTELMRKIYGGDGNTTIPHIIDPYPGADTRYIVSNVQEKETGENLLPPYVIREIDGVPVAFIGAVTVTTADTVNKEGIESVTFLDEATAINRYVKELQEEGIHSFVILLHEGGNQDPYEGPTKTVSEGAGEITGRVTDIVSNLNEDVDVVLSGHTHRFTNGYLPNAGGVPVLVTQAYYAGEAYADVTITINPVTSDIMASSAEIILTRADDMPASQPDLAVTALMAEDSKLVSPLVNEVINEATVAITRDLNDTGESVLYDLATDAMRLGMDSDIAFLNEGALRADLEEGPVMTGMLYTIEPFNNQIVTIAMTGQEILDVLEQQWQRTVAPTHLLQISGFTYAYDTSLPVGSRVTDITIDGKPMDMDATYSVASIAFLEGGGDGYTVFTKGEKIATGPIDVDQFIEYVRELPAPLPGLPDGRIKGA